MLLSLYTSVRDGLFYDYHVVEMLKHHLPLADEIIVNDGYSTDGTYERIVNLDPKIKVFRGDWGKPDGLDWIARFKNAARIQCQGRWCVNIDCDEFIPEWEFTSLRTYLESCEELNLPLRIINFYGNYKVYHSQPERVPWPDVKWNIHRNLPKMEVYGDGSNVRYTGLPERPNPSIKPCFSCHHFGFVRNPARLRQKWRNILGNLYRKRDNKPTRLFNLPSFLFDLFPYRWKDPDYLPDLVTYEGPYVKAVCDHPDEFVRDRFEMYEHLRQKSATLV